MWVPWSFRAATLQWNLGLASGLAAAGVETEALLYEVTGIAVVTETGAAME